MPCGRRNGKFEEVMAVRKKARAGVCKAAQMRSGAQHPFGMLSGVTALGGGETEVYRQIRNAVPLLDAAIGKLVRLTGGFDVCCANPAAERALRQFLKSVNVGRGQVGIESFLAAFCRACWFTAGLWARWWSAGTRLRRCCGEM